MKKISKIENHVHVYSLFIQHVQSQLPGQTSKEIEKIINECEECKAIYEDILDFFDEEEALLFEMMNTEKIENFKHLAEEKMIHYFDLTTEDNDIVNQPINFDDLHCCGG
jgi:tRNA U34 5-carboxymethylaminomethyl modifying GTPase MnmE/TrmE